MGIRKIISEVRNEPLVLSHHPMCGNFSDHYFKIGSVNLCKGCSTVYPSALISATFLLYFQVTSFSMLFYGCIILLIIDCYRFALPRREYLGAFFNLILGISLSMTVVSFLYVPSDIFLPWLVFVLVVASLFVFLKGMRVYSACKACPNFVKFPECAVVDHTNKD